MTYKPPFEISARAINLISEISAHLERFSIAMEQGDGVQLRKINRMKTIHGTLAIEGNSLSEEQVTALIEGKSVVAPLKEVQEVRNAIKAYESFMKFDPYNLEDMLKAHGIFALGLVDNPGHFRKSGVCVMGREGIPIYALIHKYLSSVGKISPMGVVQRIVCILLWVAALSTAIPLGFTLFDHLKEFFWLV